MNAHEIIRTTYNQSRSYWAHDDSRATDALAVARALCEAGYCTDTVIAEQSLEARISRVIEDLHDRYEGQVYGEDVADGVCAELGLEVAV